VLQPLASSHAVLNDDEKDLGVCIVDIGGGTTDIAVFTRGAIQHVAVIPIAGDQITNDIAMTLRTPTREAEDLKIQHGIALRQLADPKEMIEVPGIGERGPRMLSKQLLSEVIEPRVEELFSLVQAELRRSGFEEQISSGIVLSGGSSLMKGMVELAEEVFHMPVRIGLPGIHRRLLRAGAQSPFRHRRRPVAGRAGKTRNRSGFARIQGASFNQILERMKAWFQQNFESPDTSRCGLFNWIPAFAGMSGFKGGGWALCARVTEGGMKDVI
jgi:cell division protein FtsA